MQEPTETSMFDNVKDSFRGIPRFTKVIICFVVLLFLVQAIFPTSRHTLALTADFILASSVSFVQLFTAGFLEVHIISLLVNCVLFMLQGKYLEPIWGTRGFMKFIFLLNLATTITTYVLVILLYMVTGKESLLYHYYWCGFSGITSGLLVAVKQLNPEFGIPLGIFSIRAKMIPSLVFLGTVIFSCVGILHSATPFILLGIPYSWVYLRFFQKKGEIVGDLNETFSFSSFFPDAISPMIEPFSRIVYNIFEKCGVWRCLGVGDASKTSSLNMNKNDSADAERRRKRAAIALEKKLSEAEKQPTENSVEQIV